jgi:hypothetical protein
MVAVLGIVDAICRLLAMLTMLGARYIPKCKFMISGRMDLYVGSTLYCNIWLSAICFFSVGRSIGVPLLEESESSNVGLERGEPRDSNIGVAGTDLPSDFMKKLALSGYSIVLCMPAIW